MPDRLLDELPGQGGDKDAGRGLPGRPEQVLSPVRGRGEHDHRVVPEIDAVGPDAEPAQRAPAERQADGGAGHRGAREDGRGGDREYNQTALVEERRVLADSPDHDEDDDQAGERRHVEPDPPVAAGHGRLRARPDHRERGTDQQAGRPGVGALIDPGRVEARLVEGEHGRGGGRGEAQRRQREPGQELRLAPDQEHPGQQQPRPDQVELLLHGERPEVVERLRRREPAEVGGVRPDQVPVAEVPGGGPDGSAQIGEPGPVRDRDPGRDHRQHDEQSGQQAAGAPQPEIAQPHLPVRAELAQQQVRDQVSAEREEHPDAEQAARRPAELFVKGNDGQHGQCPQAVEAGHVALVRLHRLRHLRPLVAVKLRRATTQGDLMTTYCRINCWHKQHPRLPR